MSSPVLEDPATLESATIADELSTLAAHIAAATCRFLLLVLEFDRRAAWGEWGCSSCANWLAWRCSLAPGAAREHVRVARRLADLPLVRERFAAGRLSYSKVRAVTRVATPQTEAELVEIADSCTAAQLDRIVRGFRTARSADLRVAQATHARRFLRWDWEEDGSLAIRGRLGPEEGAAFVAAVEETARRAAAVEAIEVGGLADEDAAVAAELPEAVGPGARAADALTMLAETALASPAAGPRAGFTQVVLHVDAGSLAADEITHECALEAGPAVPPETARRLACDAAVIAMRSRGNGRIDAGRRTRTIPPALRRVLERRDGCCRFPGCRRRHGLAAHHVRHWARGGRTDRDNLVLLCPFHHRAVHEGGYGVRARAGAFEFARPDGLVLDAVPPARTGHPGDLPRRHGGRGIAPQTPVPPHWHGERLDLPWVVGGLCDAERRAREGKEDEGLSEPGT